MPTLPRHRLIPALSLAAVSLFVGCAAPPSSEAGSTPGTTSVSALTDAEREAYRRALAEILADDQRHRGALTWGTTDPDELARLRGLDVEASMAEMSRRRAEGVALAPPTQRRLEAEQQALDLANTRRLMELVQRFGWPTEERLGPDFPDPTAVLIHMRPEDTDAVLPLLRAEVLAGRMPPRPYASIHDRKQQHEGRPQLYGMTQAFDPETRTILPPAVVDIDATNAARAEIGLEPLEDYRLTDAKTAAGRG